MRYVPFILLAVVPVLIWPSIWTFFFVVGLGIPIGIELMPTERPRELDPKIWHPNPTVRAQRFAAAMAEWRRRGER